MIPGYNCPRPTKAQYDDFMQKLVTGLHDAKIDGLSLIIHGSFCRGDYDIGRSDIDGILVFPDNVVIDKEHMRTASLILAEALHRNPVEFQVTVTDLTT